MQAILEHGNLPPEEAEKFVALLSSEFAELRGNAATKEDVTVLGGEMREGFTGVYTEMREGFARVDTEMREGFAATEWMLQSATRPSSSIWPIGTQRCNRNSPRCARTR